MVMSYFGRMVVGEGQVLNDSHWGQNLIELPKLEKREGKEVFRSQDWMSLLQCGTRIITPPMLQLQLQKVSGKDEM